MKEFPHIHTGRELELMLVRKKPLACFSDALICLPDEEIIPEISFSPYVENGTLVREEFELESRNSDAQGKRHTLLYVLYSLPEESWRIATMKMLITEHKKTGEWNETCERIEGKLLGYTEEENDLWCSRLHDENTGT